MSTVVDPHTGLVEDEVAPPAAPETEMLRCENCGAPADPGQLMCLGVGRYVHNMLRPFMGDSVDRYYDAPDGLDPGALCGQISPD